MQSGKGKRGLHWQGDHASLPPPPAAAGVYLETTGQDGELSLGFADTAHYSGTPVYVPLTSETYWEAQVG